MSLQVRLLQLLSTLPYSQYVAVGTLYFAKYISAAASSLSPRDSWLMAPHPVPLIALTKNWTDQCEDRCEASQEPADSDTNSPHSQTTISCPLSFTSSLLDQ